MGGVATGPGTVPAGVAVPRETSSARHLGGRESLALGPVATRRFCAPIAVRGAAR
jgi:hypothetical protein